MFSFLLLILCILAPISCLDNGLARTPPMGWLAWERFRCITDCKEYPSECVSEKLLKDMADVMASEGYSELGYEYVIVDDCWMTHERDENGRLQADPERFPSGIKALADYIHNKGLKFGIYEDYGTHTCAGYPGSINHLEIDAKTFAEWGADYVKIDGCYANATDMPQGFAEFGKYLNQTGRPMVYSCLYPLYEGNEGLKTDYRKVAENCNLWRNHGDIEDSWYIVTDILNFYYENQDEFGKFAAPGQWNDPDMLIIGNYGLSEDQSKAQMALWAILASPLLMSADLRTIKPEFKAILQNKEVIAINQDYLGIQGKLVLKKDNIHIYTKLLTPVIEGSRSYAIAFLSNRIDGAPHKISVTAEEIHLYNTSHYVFTNVFNQNEEVKLSGNTITVRVNPTGVVLLKATIILKKHE